jgi:hypothetical protein
VASAKNGMIFDCHKTVTVSRLSHNRVRGE